ncbi:MAG: phage tail sheath family protein [Planctomycetota bacterium]|jgi:phage tail sheath protein FI
MPERLHPGVYIEEVPSSVKPIEAAGTSTAAFVGSAPKGDLDKAVMVTSFTEFEDTYGSFYVDPEGNISSYLAHSAYQFFNNGGRKCYIVRIAPNAVVADITLQDRKAAPASTLQISAANAGTWGNKIDLVVSDGTADPDNEFDLTVKLDDQLKETHRNLSMSPAAPNFVETVITLNSKLIRATCLPNTSDTAGTSRSGTPAEDDLSADTNIRKLRININGDGFQEITLADPVDSGDNIATAIASAVTTLTRLRGSTDPAAFTGFTCQYRSATADYLLTSGTVGIDSSVEVADASASANNAADPLKLGVTNEGREQDGSAVLRPANGTFHVGDDPNVTVTAGTDGASDITTAHYNTGLNLLDTIRDVSILAIPGEGGKEIVDSGSTYCERRAALAGVNDCFFIGEMEDHRDTKEEAQKFVASLTKKSPYTAVYFPWLKMVDPTGIRPEPISVPPSGFVAGMYAKIDGARGVWKAPAGTEANIGGATGLLKNVTDAEQDTLNNKGVNCIRAFPAAGIVIWGSRTLSTRSQPEWRYVPVRRTAIFLEVSIFNGIQWAVFEPNDEDLWASLRLNIGAFMMRLFRQGAFQGDTPSKAFFVKCDSETTTQADIDAGVVNVLVGFAPLKPAEFVVIKISQKAGQEAV